MFIPDSRVPRKSLPNSSFFILQVRDRSVADLSGGELQRFACAMVCIQKADIFMFDEPSSYLDVKQRLNAATAIRNLIEATKYVIVVEHDLAVLGKFWSRFYIVVLGIAFFLRIIYFSQLISIWTFISLFLFGLIFPFYLWTFVSLLYLDIYFLFHSGFLFPFYFWTFISSFNSSVNSSFKFFSHQSGSHFGFLPIFFMYFSFEFAKVNSEFKTVTKSGQSK